MGSMRVFDLINASLLVLIALIYVLKGLESVLKAEYTL